MLRFRGREVNLRDLALSYGLLIVVALVFVGYSLAAPNFLSLGNGMAMLHAAAPLLVTASGLSLVVVTGKLDISVGSIAFLSAAVGVLLMVRQGVAPVPAMLVTLLMGAALGALNGFLVVVLQINPLITTLGTMIGLRGVALQLTQARVISLPEAVRRLGNASLGPVFVDILVALVVVGLVHLLHTRTPFGRHVTAAGNGEEVAARLGVRVRRVSFLTFVLSGLLASAGGILGMVQIGAITSRMGQGLEFTAIAVIVIGGISLFGGEGAIVPGLILGALTLVVIENGLNHVGANPFSYRFVTGGIIFVAMYADSLKSLVRTRVRVTRDEAPGQPA